jgi:hypothetical protein
MPIITKRDKQVQQKAQPHLSKWDRAIEDARKGIRRLQTAIATFEEKKAAGEAWPGELSTHN